MIPFFENKLWDSSGKQPLLTIGPKSKDVIILELQSYNLLEGRIKN